MTFKQAMKQDFHRLFPLSGGFQRERGFRKDAGFYAGC